MRRSALPYLDDLRAFEATARCGSVRAAADEMNLTHAAVSRRIGRLSERVGAPLFEKAGRGLRLTPAGGELADACRRSFDDLARTIRGIREAAGMDDEAILLSCERSVAMRWLIPRLSAFQDANPGVAVHLSVGGGALDRRRDRVTLALRRLDFELSADWTAVPLFDETVGPVMAPQQQAAFASGSYVALGSGTRPSAWDDWMAQHPDAPTPKDRRMFDHHFLMVEAACSGLGVAIAPRVVTEDDIRLGRLIAPLGFAMDGSKYGILRPVDVALTDGAHQLMKWLEETSSEFRA